MDETHTFYETHTLEYECISTIHKIRSLNYDYEYSSRIFLTLEMTSILLNGFFIYHWAPEFIALSIMCY